MHEYNLAASPTPEHAPLNHTPKTVYLLCHHFIILQEIKYVKNKEIMVLKKLPEK